jgi:His-Xaa-Ser system radical SAM maturase HxsB
MGLLEKSHFLPARSGYSLLPFRFDRLTNGTCLVVNEVGEFVVLSDNDFRGLVDHRLQPEAPAYALLRAKHFITDGSSSAHFDVLAAKYRTKKSFLDGFAKLHIFVTTLRCNQACPYCQVSRHDESADGSTMTVATIHKSVDLMLANPSPAVTMEFQGGESLLAFDVVVEAIRYAKERNALVGKRIDFVICTNLAALTDEHLEFFKTHAVQVSSSLDGPAFLHDRNRPLNGGPSHARVERNIRRAQEALGRGCVSCLMTTTRESLQHPREIVDEYVRLDMGSLFVRDLNPYGFAVKAAVGLDYPTSAFVAFYKEVLAYIIEINRGGRTFQEALTALVLSKVLTPWPIGFVDLQSPCGAGFGVVVYNYDGEVYASDESRMLAEMGQPVFRLGNVAEDTYDKIFFGEGMQMLATAACNESLAGCSDCAYQAYCGADPVRHYRTQGEMFGHRPTSSFCQKNMGVIKHVFDLLLSGDAELEKIFWAWIQREDVNRMMPGAPEWLPA